MPNVEITKIQMKKWLITVSTIITLVAITAAYFVLKSGGASSVSPPLGFTQTGQYTQGGYTYTSYLGTSAIQDALNAFRTQMEGAGWTYKAEVGSVGQYSGNLYERGGDVAVVSATQAGANQVVVVVVIGVNAGSTPTPSTTTPRHDLYATASVDEAYWASGDGGQPVAVHEVGYVIYNRGTEPETASLTLYVDGSPQSLGTVSIPMGGDRSDTATVRLGEGSHSIQIVATSANTSAQASPTLSYVSFAQWPTEVRMPPKLSMTVNPPSLMYLGYENNFTVSVSNSGGPASVGVSANSYEYTVQIDAGKTKALEVPQVADDLGDGNGDVYYNFSVEVSASNTYGSDAENGSAQARVIQKPVDVWYSLPELESKQSFWTKLGDFFTFITGYDDYVEKGSASVSRMVYQLNRHDNSIMNMKEIYYFVRGYLPYDYNKADAWYLGLGQGFGFMVQYPVESLQLQKGICLDKAILLASMLEAAGFDATLVYAYNGSVGHAFTAVYLPGYLGDHPKTGVGVPYGSSQDWLYLDAVSTGIRFGEDWTHKYGWGNYKIVDVGTTPVTPLLKVVDTYWTKDNVRVSTAKVGENVMVHVSLIATGGAASETVDVQVWKDIAFWFDSEFASASFAVSIPHLGEIQTVDMAFAPDAASAGSLKGYYIHVSLDGGARTYTMNDEYPPRLRATS